MTITVHWWWFVLFLFVFPFIYGWFFDRGGYYEVDAIAVIIIFTCWGLALGILIGHFL
jgi:hypothetical protein